MKARIVSVDFNGYLGREDHPQERHIGEVVRVVGMETWFWDEDGGEPTNLATTIYGASIRSELVSMLEQEDRLETAYIAYTSKGERLELMAHEVEVL